MKYRGGKYRGLFFLNLTMRFDLFFVSRHRLLMHIDPTTRVLSSAIKRSYSQHATQSSPRAQNPSPPPAKRHRGASSGSPLSSPPSTSEHLNLDTRPFWSFEPGPSSSSPRQPSLNAKRGSLKRSEKKPVVKQKTLLPGPYHNEIYIEKEHNISPMALKRLHKETPRSSVNNFYHTLTGKLPTYKTIDGTIMQGNQAIHVHR